MGEQVTVFYVSNGDIDGRVIHFVERVGYVMNSELDSLKEWYSLYDDGGCHSLLTQDEFVESCKTISYKSAHRISNE